MLNVIIIDNKKAEIDTLKTLLLETGQIEVIDYFTNAADACSKIPALPPDAVFLDIELPGMTGIELAEKIMLLNWDIEVIFVTASEQHAFKAFQVNALDYLLKPLSYEDIERSVTRLKKRKKTFSADIDRPDNGHIYCFGKLMVYGPGCSQTIKWRTSKAEELFAFMLQNLNKEVSKWKICEALWPEYGKEKVDTYLHTTIYTMKKNLTAANISFDFIFANGCYTLKLPGIYIDTAEFDSFINADHPLTNGTVEKYEKALALYKSDYLGENGYPWSISKMADYLEKYHRIASTLVDYFIKETNYLSAEKVLQKVLKKYPFNDELNETLLQLYFTKKDRIALITHYNTIKHLYQTELGIAPSVTMQTLYNKASSLI